MPFVGRTRWGHWMLCSCGPRTWLGPFPPTLGLASPWTELPQVGTPFWSVAAVSGDSGLPCEGPCPCVPVLSLTLYPGLRGKSGQRFQLLTQVRSRDAGASGATRERRMGGPRRPAVIAAPGWAGARAGQAQARWTAGRKPPGTVPHAAHRTAAAGPGACWCLRAAVICVSLVTCSAEPLPTCLAAIWVCSSLGGLFRPSAHFYITPLAFGVLGFKSFG